jgi:hypothetical protein
MPTLPSDTTPKTDANSEQNDPEQVAKKRNQLLKQGVEASKQYRKKLIANWTVSIDYRRGKPFASQTDEDRVAVNLDWPLTKSKIAALFSQMPQIRVSHPPQTVAPDVSAWVHKFEQKVNDTLILSGTESAMDEAMPDCINAAGFGAILVAHESIMEDVDVPAIPLDFFPPPQQEQILQSKMLPDGTPLPMTTVPRAADHRYVTMRISPADFLWPANFSGSDFDSSPWIGRSGRISWAEGSKKWKLNEADKSTILGEDRTSLDRLTHDVDKDKQNGEEIISFDEIWYKEFQYDPQAKSFSAIHHVVFVNGKEKPVVDEPWKGQEKNENNQIIGVLRYPLQVVTLTYLTDEAIPPSDSAVARPQVNELNKSRTQMMLQRERSIPVRWFDVNRIDPTIQQALMRGVWQGMIPVQGQGTNVIGEVQRSQMPQENYLFDKIAKSDLLEIFQVGQGDSGANVETKGEAQVIQTNRQTNVAKERARVAKFFCKIAEILGGLICLYEDKGTFGDGFDPAVSRTLSYSILSDSTMLLDANQRLERALNFYNFCMKTGWLAEEPVLREIATLSGFDPSVVIQKPEPKPPSEPNISLRLTGTEDMMNPLTLAFLMKSGQAPDSALIEQAKQLILAAVIPAPNAIPTPPPAPQMGPDGEMLDAPPPPGGAVPLPIPTGPAMPVTPPPPSPPGVGEAHPNLSAMPRVNQRVLDRGDD